MNLPFSYLFLNVFISNFPLALLITAWIGGGIDTSLHPWGCLLISNASILKRFLSFPFGGVTVLIL